MKKKQRNQTEAPGTNKFYRAIAKIFGGFFRCLYRVHTTGLEHLPKEGGFIICANHIGYPDAVLLVASQPCQIRFFG